MTAEQQHTIGLQTAKAEMRPITQTLRVPGTIEFDPGHVAIVRPLAQARISRLLVAPGDTVQAGQALATVEIPSLIAGEQDLASAKAALRQAEAAVSVAKDAWQRGVILTRDGSLSRAETQRRQLVLAQARETEDVARNRMQNTKVQVDRLDPSGSPGMATLAAPLGGIVVNAKVTPGELIDTTTDGFTVADLSVVIAQAQIPEASATLVQMGDKATVRLATGDGRTWQGEVSALGAALDPRARTLPARITLQNPDHTLRAGMFIEATIAASLHRQGVTVPATAVQFVGNRRVAFTPVGDNKFQARDLTLGAQQADWDEVRKGLSAGESVVTGGSFSLKALLQEAMLGSGGG